MLEKEFKMSFGIKKLCSQEDKEVDRLRFVLWVVG